MNYITNIFKSSYYKLRIIITFSIFTVILVIIMSMVSFYFVKDLYLEQLGDQVKITSAMTANRVDKNYLELLQIGIPSKSTADYFRKIFSGYTQSKPGSKIFLFDKNLNIIIHSDLTVMTGSSEPRLLINQNEILQMKIKSANTSLPFKGDDNKWYLWGFYRLNDNYWIALQESAERFEKVDNLSTIFWLIGLAGTLITILLGWIAAGSISKPIDKLVKFSNEIGKGNILYSPPQNMKGEIAILSQSLDKMRKDLLEHQNEKENILAQIAHEIRNPLGGIELLINLIKEDSQANPRNVEYINKILSELSGLKTLITSFLNYSRPNPPAPQWIKLPDLFCDLENLFRDKFIHKNITFKIDSDVASIFYDQMHFKQILINLITNSIESINGNGAISIKASTKNNKWNISVSDNGNGIASEHRSKIFTPFFTTKKNGTGLGLAISSKLAKENNSELILNDDDKGCTFTIIKEVNND